MVGAIESSRHLNYTGEVQPEPGERDIYGRQIEPYLASPELVEAVNLAIQLGRPLLLKGEPGSGKTRLARAVAYELGLLDDAFESWHVKSTSRARDGLYTYDAVGRLRDAQLVLSHQATSKERERSQSPSAYVRFGPLGRAFQNPKRTVVLIDEIDKADIDFPNDLLLELDEKRFTIDELEGREVRAVNTPIVFITSNDEKDLPDAFLRRCLFHYLEFPDQDQLTQIVVAHFPESPAQLVEKVIERFLDLRSKMENSLASKRVSTSELIDWFRVLHHYEDEETLARFAEELLFPGVLLKTWEDYRQYTTLMRRNQDAP